MRRKSKRQQEQYCILERLAAEDRAVDHLCTNFARETAAVIATRVECSCRKMGRLNKKRCAGAAIPGKSFKFRKKEVQKIS